MVHKNMKITIAVMEENPDGDSLAEVFTDLPYDPFVGAEKIIGRKVLSTEVMIEDAEIVKYYVIARKP